jgi:hypothetical protein
MAFLPGDRMKTFVISQIEFVAALDEDARDTLKSLVYSLNPMGAVDQRHMRLLIGDFDNDTISSIHNVALRVSESINDSIVNGCINTNRFAIDRDEVLAFDFNVILNAIRVFLEH